MLAMLCCVIPPVRKSHCRCQPESAGSSSPGRSGFTKIHCHSRALGEIHRIVLFLVGSPHRPYIRFPFSYHIPPLP
jgi:hypothetical protein